MGLAANPSAATSLASQLSCKLCAKRIRPQHMVHHSFMSHSNMPAMYYCSVCEHASQRATMSIHMTRFHRGVAVAPEQTCWEKFPEKQDVMRANVIACFGEQLGKRALQKWLQEREKRHQAGVNFLLTLHELFKFYEFLYFGSYAICQLKYFWNLLTKRKKLKIGPLLDVSVKSGSKLLWK